MMAPVGPVAGIAFDAETHGPPFSGSSILHLRPTRHDTYAQNERKSATLRNSGAAPLKGTSMPPQKRRIGVFGGTFDPIHVGHLIVAEILQHELELERVIFLPAGRPPHKPSQVLAADHDRIEMIRRATRRSPSFIISMIDLERPGYSFTAKSLQILSDSIDGEVDLYFLMGQDSLRSFPTWHRPDLIAEQARLGVALRPGFDVKVSEIEALVPETKGRIEVVPVPLIGISSRDIRQRIVEGKPYRYQVPPLVADYIDEMDLYQSEADNLTALGEQTYTRTSVTGTAD